MAWRPTRRFSTNAPENFDFHTGAEPAPTQTRRRPRTFFGAEDLVIDDGAEDEPVAPPPPADEPPPQSGRTRCVAANDLVLDECGDEL